MRVVLSSLWYPMSISRYIEKALRRRPDVELFTAGPYTGTWIPWQGGMNLPARYAIQPDLAFPLGNEPPVIPITFVENKLPWLPDLWIQVDAGILDTRQGHDTEWVIMLLALVAKADGLHVIAAYGQMGADISGDIEVARAA